ncbi:MAG: NifU N-terminal domain-containing protein [Phycisphaerae bacterium]|nr:NifU N-terminal domain-containing protein [Phycisphaerae bacterium]
MPYTVKEFHQTPNPNALKCILDRVIRERELGPASYRTAAAAGEDPVAAALFKVAGVTNLLINEDWITVNKDPKAEWKAVKAGVSKALAGLG